MFVLSLLLVVMACKERSDEKEKSEPIEEQLVLKEYGHLAEFSIFPQTELSPGDFDSFSNLFERCEEIVCNDSVPVISIDSESVIKKVRLVNKCPENESRFSRDSSLVYISIRNDSIYKDRVFYPIDSLGHFITTKFERGIQIDKKFIIILTNESCKKDSLVNRIDYLTDLYESETGRTDVGILFFDRSLIPPPPTPPICVIRY